MTKKENEPTVGNVTVTLKIPEPVYHFFGAVANTYKKKLEEIMVEELIADVKGFTDTEAEKILIGAFELENYVQ